MLRLTDIQLPLNHAEADLKNAILKRLKIEASDLISFNIFKRSYDARKKTAIVLIYTVDVEAHNEAALLATIKDVQGQSKVGVTPDTSYKFVTHAKDGDYPRPVVIGFGPCGLFAALILAQMGFKPIVLERGKAVRERTKDTWGLWRKRELQPESNVQFGEGGAGTFSDGKLYSQVKDPKHYGRKVLTEFVKAGAPEEIMYVSKPHIGTFRLVKMIEEMRANIIELGGEIRFQQKVTDFDVKDGVLNGLTINGDEKLAADHVVLAIGHSARDTFQLVYDKGIYVEAKPFSVGFRIEHPQSLIDRARYGGYAGDPTSGGAYRSPCADHCDDRQCHGSRSTGLHGSGYGRLCGQTVQCSDCTSRHGACDSCTRSLITSGRKKADLRVGFLLAPSRAQCPLRRQ